ncbi:cbb3-type cytochrome oxidase assembly protein CcoS [Leeuwenhoekiella parthenopeia]|uniref:Cbb3-type cytochrome oxidase assembly protein CcoS n=1 Tax=Leeuwenhoekiella parthenopeia TaxID=2890320 RepID=A0ABS8GPZ9_9FLAO|nr:cbb3-type cytochrome oxidase assembly protein CcoS [Leeuwenhoekiella parthenopeia]MCC4212061.1 cbb3-type cytochrome oxidase assembly protein CcoS [Leeuwenhoekiella parthenopeia]
MSIIYMLLAISVVVALVFFAAFIFSVRKGQYDDTYTPSVRMLFEDELVKNTGSSADKNQQSITNHSDRKSK